MNFSPPVTEAAGELAPVGRETGEKAAAAGTAFRSPVRRLTTPVLLIVLLIVAGWDLWTLFTQLTPQLIGSRGPGGDDSLVFLPEKSVAVLPFEDRSKGDGNAFPADGVQAEILTTLSKIADLKVISSTSVN